MTEFEKKIVNLEKEVNKKEEMFLEAKKRLEEMKEKKKIIEFNNFEKLLKLKGLSLEDVSLMVKEIENKEKITNE